MRKRTCRFNYSLVTLHQSFLQITRTGMFYWHSNWCQRESKLDLYVQFHWNKLTHKARQTKRWLMTRISRIEFRESAGWDSLKHLLGEDSQKLPTNVQRLKDCAIFVAALRDEVLLKLWQEFQVQQIVRRQRLFSHDSFHCLNVFSNGVTCVLKDTFRIIKNNYTNIFLE